MISLPTSRLSPRTSFRSRRCAETSRISSTSPRLITRRTTDRSRRKNSSSPSSPEPRTPRLSRSRSSSETSTKNPRPRVLSPTPSRPLDTTTSSSRSSTKKSRRPRLNSSDLSPRPTLKFLSGEPSTRPTLFSELRSLRKLRRSLLLDSRKLKRPSKPPRLSALLSRSPSLDRLLRSKTSPSSLSEPPRPLPSSTRSSETSTRSLPKPSRSRKKSRPNSNNPRKNPDPSLPSFSRPRTPTKNPSTLSRLSNEKTRTSKKKSLTPANRSTSSRRTSEPSMLSETNYRPPLKKLKPLSSLRNPRFSDSRLRLPRSSRTSSDDLPRRTRKSTTADETDSELSNLCRPPSTPKSEPVVKLSEPRRRWNLTSTISRSSLDMLTDSAAKLRSA